MTTAQIVINEIMASNSKTIQDNVGEFSDWIELFNTSNAPVNLNGYYLSDNPEKITKFQLSSTNGNLTIPAKGFILIWCSGNTKNGDNHTSFSLSSEAEFIILTKPDGKNILDNIEFKNQRTDISFGRTQDGGNQLKYIQKASPNQSNNNIPFFIDALSEPVFSKKGGFYETNFSLTLSHPDPTVKILYTLDGSIPKKESLGGKTYFYKNQYPEKPGQADGELLEGHFETKTYENSTIEVKKRNQEVNKISQISSTWHFDPYYIPKSPIAKATVVRAVAIKEGYLESKIIAQTYFLDNNGPKNPAFDLVSLNIQEDFLFDFNKGLYNAGKAFEEYRIQNPNVTAEFCTPGNFSNEGIDYEKPLNFELFRNQNQEINQNITFKIHGACSRSNPYKSLRIYGSNQFDKFPLIKRNNDLKLENILLRNTGDDFNNGMIRDVFIHDWLHHFKFGSQASQPTLVYLNGEYWGVQNIRERIDKYYLNEHYGVNIYNIDLKKIVWNGPDEIEYGDDIHYKQMMNFLETTDLTVKENYEKAITFLDPESLIDYQIAEIFVGNIDWPQNNVRLWRNKTPEYAPFAPKGMDGRWRYLFFDADKSLGMIINAEDDAFEVALNKEENFIFRTFIKNETFRKQFILRFQDHLNSTFLKEYSTSVFKEFRDKYRLDIEDHISRWKTVENLSTWENNCNVIENYISQRAESMRRFLKNRFSQTQENILSVASIDNSMGFVKVNSLDINVDQPGVLIKNDGNWEGKYFQSIPLTLTAKPKPGHRFLYWEHENQKITDSVLVVILNKNEKYVAYFEQSEFITQLNTPASSLIDCGYYFEEWSSFSSAGSTPPNARFVFLNQKEPEESATIAGFTKGTFDQDSKTRVRGLESEGISFVNTSGPSENTGYPYNQLGGMIIAVNTKGIDSAWVSWTAKTIEVGERKYGIKLYYRIGDSAEFVEIDKNQTYLGNNIKGHLENFLKIPIPKGAIGKEYVQFFWKYYYTGVGKSGPRDEIGLDDIIFTTNFDKTTSGSFVNSENNLRPKWSFIENNLKLQNNEFKLNSGNFGSVRPKNPFIESKKLEICGSEKLKITASGCINGTIFWSNGEIGREIEVSEGEYYAYCSASCGISENSNSLKIKRIEKLKGPELESNKEIICLGEAVTLIANSCDGIVNWSNGLSQSKITVKPLENTSYSATCEANQCQSELSNPINISIGKPNILKIQSSSNKLCLGESTFLTAPQCDGTVEWDNGNFGETIKFTASKVGETIFRARCNSFSKTCTGEWSEPIYFSIPEKLTTPDVLSELYVDCSFESTDLNLALIDSTKNLSFDYIFYKKDDQKSAPLSNTKNVESGSYYVYKKNAIGCFSKPAKINIITKNCESKIGKGDIGIYLKSDKSKLIPSDSIEIKLIIKNNGDLKSKNILSKVPIPENLIVLNNSQNSNNELIINSLELNPKDSLIYDFKILVLNSRETELNAYIEKTDFNDYNLENNISTLKLETNNPLGISINEGELRLVKNNVFEKTIEIFLENTSSKNITPIQLNLNLNKYFPTSAKFIEDSIKIETENNLVVNKNFKGNLENQNVLVDSLSHLKAKSIHKIRLSFQVDLSEPEDKTFFIQASANSSNVYSDLSTNGINPDPDYDGNADNNMEFTPLNFESQVPKPAIAIAQAIIDSNPISIYEHAFTFAVLVKNIGKSNLKNVIIKNNLRAVFGENSFYFLKEKISSSKNSVLIPNQTFDGNQNIDFTLGSVNLELLPNQTDTLVYTIHVGNQNLEGPFFSSITVSALDLNGEVVSDTSNNGLEIIPFYSDPTVIIFENIYRDKPIVSGGISPNDDNQNDELNIFIPNGIKIEYMDIYNRWGIKIATLSEENRVGNNIKWKVQKEMTKSDTVETLYYILKEERNPIPIINYISVQP
ncbi:CotH kinase family protein [Lacihabitans sp. LS3-19]|uniref:CotH kinase family protein n=1 Tax=Lacihabitans sp. LS3-19 TaxID=2487335 RepID=UPI0020CBF7EE|nr:CotH kinase family protein [Lacihabitans sp. LS3-19]